MKTSLSTLPILLSISICAPISVRSASKTNSPAGAKPAAAAPLFTAVKSPLAPALTNRAPAQIILPDRLVWTNIFDTGPQADLEYRYNALRGSLEQNVIIHQAPSLPKGWNAADVSLECWTEVFDSVPLSTESQSIIARPASADTGAVQADDTTINF